MTEAANDNDPIRFLSVCSGIEAASVAWGPLGWQCVAVSEIEKFPSAVLAHHYPDVPNLGDFTMIDTTQLGRVDILCGGTPCQAFSIAGLRNSLADARGNLSLEFVRLAHELAGISPPRNNGSAADADVGGRAARRPGNGLRNVIWENVPGVLNTKDNAFGCLLGAFVGADDALPPPDGRRWPSHGMVSGPKGRAAWAVKNAEFFGVPQRRRRVVLVADFGDGADPAAVLFELFGVPGYTPPSREARKDVAPTISARTKGGGGLGTDFDLDGGVIEAAMPIPIDMRQASRGATMTNNRPEGTSGGAPGTGIGSAGDPSPTVSTSHVPAVYAPEIARCVATREGSSQDYETTTMVAQAVCVTGAVTHTLKAEGADASEDGTGRGTPIVAEAYRVAGDGAVYREGDRAAPLTTGTDPSASVVCFSSKDYGADASVDVSPTLRASGHTESHANAGAPPAIAFTTEQTPKFNEDCALTITKQSPTGGGQIQSVMTPSAVRRLTPVECERLQGFPDDYTAIP